MNIFTEHPQQQGISYLEHMLFAMGIAIRLFNSVIAFTLHAIFPFIDIKKSQDLEATMGYLQERNQWIESKKPQLSSTDNSKLWGQMPLARLK